LAKVGYLINQILAQNDPTFFDKGFPGFTFLSKANLFILFLKVKFKVRRIPGK